MKITKTGEYTASQETLNGSKKEILAYLRGEALEMRKGSRDTMKGVANDVHSIIGAKKHTSEVVNLATYDIKQMNIEQLLPLVNAHGVMSYEISEIITK